MTEQSMYLYSRRGYRGSSYSTLSRQFLKLSYRIERKALLAHFQSVSEQLGVCRVCAMTGGTQRGAEANCDITVSGVTAQIKNSDLQYACNLHAEGGKRPWGKDGVPYELLKTSSTTLGFYEPKFIVTPEEADQIEQVESQMQAEAMMMQQAGNVTALPPKGGTGNASE